MSYAPSSPDDAYSSDAAGTLAGQYTLNNKVMVAAIIVLFFVVFFILSLHVHSKWIWTRSSSFMMSNRSSQGIYFVGGQEVNSAEAAHNIGLDKAAIDQLPTFIYKAPKAAGGGRELALIECAVCLSEFQESEKGRLLPTCKHSFHTDCIDMWFHSHSTCPLCRTVVMPIPLSSSTSEQQQQQQQAEDVQQQAENAMEAHLLTHNDPLLRAREGTSVPSSTINYGNAMLQCPSNALVWGNQTQVISQLSSSQGSEKPPSPPTPPSCSSSSSSTRRSIPQITIEIPTRQDNLTSPGCLSLSSLSRSCPSPSDQACSSQPIKSPGLRMSVKRKLSRQSSKGKRILGSYLLQEGGHSPKDITTLPV